MREPTARATPCGGHRRPIAGTPDPASTQVGRGTLLGESMRRFRQPVAMAPQLGQGPIAVHALETLAETDRSVLPPRRARRRSVEALAASRTCPSHSNGEAAR